MADDRRLLPPQSKENLSPEQLKITKLNDDEKEYEKSIKVILLGDTNVGKSSVIDRLKNNPFDSNPHPTLTLEHHNLIIKINSFVLRMQIWDTAGQEKFDSITSTYYKSTDVAIFVYAINNEESFNRIPGWIKELEDKNVKNDKNNENEESLMIKILLGNKTDLEDERKITIEEGENFANNNGFSFFTEISCKENKDEENNIKINKIIEIIGKEFYKYSNEERLNSSSYIYEASQSLLDSKNESKSCHC